MNTTESTTALAAKNDFSIKQLEHKLEGYQQKQQKICKKNDGVYFNASAKSQMTTQQEVRLILINNCFMTTVLHKNYLTFFSLLFQARLRQLLREPPDLHHLQPGIQEGIQEDPGDGALIQ